MINSVIFDLDGVLTSTDDYHYQAWKELADSLGIPFDKEVNNRLRGVSRMASFEIILEASGKEYTQDEKEAFCTKKNDRYRELLTEMEPGEWEADSRAVLEELKKRGYKLSVGSSSKNAGTILERIGFTDLFDAISDGTNISASKPDPEVFLKAAEFLGVTPDECLVVEDAESGAEAAHRGGMKCVCIGDAARLEAGDYNMENLKELLEICPAI